VADKGKLLAVDDTPASLKLLTTLLKEEGYEVRAAISGELALYAATHNPPELILLDIRMPEMDGLEVCRRLKAQPQTRHVPIIFVSAITETDEKVKGFELGAVDFVTKPYQREELLARVRTHLEVNRLRHRLEEMVEERTSELVESEKKLRSCLLDFIEAMAATIEMRDPYTAGHQRRVSNLAVAIGRELQLPEEQLEGLHLAGVVHDVGKIPIPAEILSMPRQLSSIEFSLIKEHPKIGYEIMRAIDFPWPIAQAILQHHERLDGSGYPQGLKDKQILMEAKILAIADVVEAISSHRPYRPSLGVGAALEEIESNSGNLYDSVVARACLRLFRERGYQLPT
jgi:response regulator RpfG family c-di-GMP phosphodiesterase